eukprot:scaffold11546_cov129-Isochrysis_galbana.AAC.2
MRAGSSAAVETWGRGRWQSGAAETEATASSVAMDGVRCTRAATKECCAVFTSCSRRFSRSCARSSLQAPSAHFHFSFLLPFHPSYIADMVRVDAVSPQESAQSEAAGVVEGTAGLQHMRHQVWQVLLTESAEDLLEGVALEIQFGYKKTEINCEIVLYIYICAHCDTACFALTSTTGTGDRSRAHGPRHARRQQAQVPPRPPPHVGTPRGAARGPVLPRSVPCPVLPPCRARRDGLGHR